MVGPPTYPAPMQQIFNVNSLIVIVLVVRNNVMTRRLFVLLQNYCEERRRGADRCSQQRLDGIVRFGEAMTVMSVSSWPTKNTHSR